MSMDVVGFEGRDLSLTTVVSPEHCRPSPDLARLIGGVLRLWTHSRREPGAIPPIEDVILTLDETYVAVCAQGDGTPLAGLALARSARCRTAACLTLLAGAPDITTALLRDACERARGAGVAAVVAPEDLCAGSPNTRLVLKGAGFEQGIHNNYMMSGLVRDLRQPL